ncbi:MAG: DUF3142 domain-containing protein [Alphaproteobacteria bacterium]|nr:DUF3142 domain-containing protein [Alphaproteobacteria bacterium]
MRLLAAMLLCVVGLSASAVPMRAPDDLLRHDAYVWQRVWTPELRASLQASSDLVRAWRILVAEASRTGQWAVVDVPWRHVDATDRPVVAVIRIDGRLDEARMPAMVEAVLARIADAQAARGAEAPFFGVEVDYDCPTSKLVGYARFLSELRQRLPQTTALSITALPTWMMSRDLELVTGAVDEVVLQVHAVDDPREGLFDPVRAETWVKNFAHRTRLPFRLAIPAYGVRVTFRSDGRLASVEGETPVYAGAANARTLGADPREVSNFLQSLQHIAPFRLAGVAWFRLPTAADSRAWSLETWRAVVAGRLPDADIVADLAPTASPGLWAVTLSNPSPIDRPLPRRVELDSACAIADGANGFRLAQRATDDMDGPVLQASGGDWLRANRTRTIGWARCAEGKREPHVVP